jgi:protein-L-isoaspartate(D-aspartate) O-methyltransferase
MDWWRRALTLGAALAALLPGTLRAADADDHAAWRAVMIRVIERHALSADRALGRTWIDLRVLEVMGRTPRHRFVPKRLRDNAYDDRPLPIGYGQTISQPFIVALMTDLLAVGPEDVVLEVGTGSGYQAAVLAPLVRRVCSIEIIPELARSAERRLETLGYTEVETRTGDGYYGWPECGPFDGIVVTAAASQVPPPLIAQVKPGGRMVIPVGGPYATQWLMVVDKLDDGRVRTRQVLPVAFVPFTRRSP